MDYQPQRLFDKQMNKNHQYDVILNKELKGLSKVVGAFPNDDSLLKLVVSILFNINEEWITGRRYLIM